MVAQGRLSFLYKTQLDLCTFRFSSDLYFFCFQMCQIYIARKIKIQGVPWCKNQSRYHISCYTTAQVMFIFLLFECATFVRKAFNVQQPPWFPTTLTFSLSVLIFLRHTTHTMLFLSFFQPPCTQVCWFWAVGVFCVFGIIFFIWSLINDHSLYSETPTSSPALSLIPLHLFSSFRMQCLHQYCQLPSTGIRDGFVGATLCVFPVFSSHLVWPWTRRIANDWLWADRFGAWVSNTIRYISAHSSMS